MIPPALLRSLLPLTMLGLLLPAQAADKTPPNPRRNRVVEVVENVSPAVVHIGTERIVTTGAQPFSRDPFFHYFFGNGTTPARRTLQESLGSGVIVAPRGLVITNDHVIRGASKITVRLNNEQVFTARVIGTDYNTDLALLQIEQAPPKLPTAPLGSSADLMIGETLIAIGSPFGLTHTVTVGVASAVGRSFQDKGRIINDLIQTDAAINPGNSGGPLLNIDGKIVGINTAIRADAEGIGFAIPVDKVRRIIEELVTFGKVRPAWLGLRVQELNPILAHTMKWYLPYGLLINKVESFSPAAKAGLKRGQIIVEVGGRTVHDITEFRAYARSYPAKTRMPIKIFLNDELKVVTLYPSEYPDELVQKIAWNLLGLSVIPKAAQTGKTLLTITMIRPGGVAERSSLQRGDWILSLNGEELSSVENFRDALVTAINRNSVVLLIQRGAGLYYATLNW